MDVPGLLPLLDPIDQRLLRLLRADARMSVRGLSREIGMSAGAVGERLERLESRGVILGYRVDVDPIAIGLGLEVLLGIELERGSSMANVISSIQAFPEAVHLDRTTGRWDAIARLVLRDQGHFAEVLDRPTWADPTVRRVETLIVIGDRPR